MHIVTNSDSGLSHADAYEEMFAMAVLRALKVRKDTFRREEAELMRVSPEQPAPMIVRRLFRVV